MQVLLGYAIIDDEDTLTTTLTPWGNTVLHIYPDLETAQKVAERFNNNGYYSFVKKINITIDNGESI